MPKINQEPSRKGVRALTTDATQTTLAEFQTRSNHAYLVTAKVLGLKTNDFNLVAGYRLHGVFKNVGGTLSLVQSTVDDFGATSAGEDPGAAAWAVILDTSGATIRVRVTGAASTNITWLADVDVLEAGEAKANYGLVA